VAVYLDAAAGPPPHPVAAAAATAAEADGWADPGRLHAPGRRARLLLDAARESMADSVGARPDEIVFTANATLARHAAVLGCVRGARPGLGAIVHSAIEHSALLHAANWQVARGGRAQSVPVDRLAHVDKKAFVAATRASDVAVAVLQSANHEVGTRQPVGELAGLIEPTGVPLVVDATQTLGREPVQDGWSVLVGDGRMWGAPPVGVLAVRSGVRWRSPWPEDDHVGGRSPGVPDVRAVVAAAATLRAMMAEQAAEDARQRALVTRLRTAVAASVPDVEVLGDPDDRLPHIVTFSCLYVDGEALLGELDRRGFAVSSGSSCTSSTLEPSHVLVAMGALTSGNVRVSLHRDVSAEDVEAFLAVLPDAVAAVRSALGAEGL
jgi:cysteine desulfurase